MAPMTPLQVAAAAYIGGFKVRTAEAVAMAKVQSGYEPTLVRGDNYGLWQIRYSRWKKEFEGKDWANPVDNARIAWRVFQEGRDIPNTNGDWQEWPSAGGARFKLALPEGKRAEAELRKRIARGDSLEEIAGAKRSDGSGGSPTDGPVSDVFRGAQAVTGGLPELGALARGLTSANTWLRVGQVVIGVALVLVGVAAMANLAGKTPVGRVARALK